MPVLHEGPKGYVEAHEDLQRLLADLAVEHSKSSARLRVSRSQAAEARQLRDAAAGELPHANRQREKVEKEVQTVAAALLVEQQRHTEQQHSLKGLRRTLTRLQGLLVDAAAQVKCQGQAAKNSALVKEAAQLEIATTSASIGGLREDQEELQRQLTAQRAKNSALQAAARGKLYRVESTLAALRAPMATSLKEAADALAAEKALLQAAHEKHLLMQRALQEAGETAERKRSELDELQKELVQVQTTSTEVFNSLEEVKQKLAALLQQDAEVQKQWRQRHMDKMDSKAEELRMRDKEIVVCED